MTTLDTSQGLLEPPPHLRLDERRLLEYLRAAVPGLAAASALRVQQFGHGQSNPTYLLRVSLGGGGGGDARLVLRKKPPPPTLPSAHAVEREFRVLSALAAHAPAVPVPAPLALCEDARVAGTPFFLMRHVDGVVHASPAMPGAPPAARAAAYAGLAAALAALHAVDPAAAGLAGFGPAAGYGARQARRWAAQAAASAPAGGPLAPRLAALGAALAARVPARDADPAVARVVHGDFRLDNLVFEREGRGGAPPRVLAVLDWELATLGDPLADLAYACLPYHLPACVPQLGGLPSPPPPGVPPERGLCDAYFAARGAAEAAAGRPPPPRPAPAEWRFHVALALFRLAAILAGVGARARAGNASSAAAARMGADAVVLSVVEAAERVLLAGAGGAGALDARVPLAGTPAEPYANPAHPDARADGTPGVLEGTPAEEYANPTPAWRAAAAAAARAADEAERLLPPAGAAAAARQQGAGPGCGGGGSGGGGGASGGSGGGPPVLGLGPSPRAAALLRRLRAFMAAEVYPAEAALAAHAAGPDRWTVHPRQAALAAAARAAGLWNLWLPPDVAATLRPLVLAECGGNEAAAAGLLGPGLSALEYAHLAEELGRSPAAAEAANCSAPDTGNMEVLARYGSAAQQRRWLLPLLRGECRSCFAMTEPGAASSDATNIAASIDREVDPATGEPTGFLVLNGRKWWISGAPDPRCRVAIFMGVSSALAAAGAPRHRRHTMVLVPMDAPGLRVERALPVFGFDDAPHGHAVVAFDGVRAPADAVVLGEGRGFEVAQGRLGPGRLHHCMRLVGAGERALELAAARAKSRVAFGRPLAEHQSVRLDLARSRVELDAARLTVLEAARALDAAGARAAAPAIAAAKALVPSAVLRLLDRAIQVHGGAGVSDGTPLAAMWAAARTLRLADGPDVVHLETVAKAELRRARL